MPIVNPNDDQFPIELTLEHTIKLDTSLVSIKKAMNANKEKS
jgi:hypothetical protein